MSSFIDSRAGLVQSVWIVLALVLKTFIIAKLMFWVWCGAAIMNEQIIYMLTNTGTC